MSTITDLREKSLRYAHEARDLLNQITDKTDEARAADLNTQADRALAESDALEARADALAKIEARDSAMSASQSARVTEDRSIDATGDVEARASGAFNAYLRNGERSPLLVRAQSVGTSADGGYSVPTTLHGTMIDTFKAFGGMLDGSVVTLLETAGGGTYNFVTSDDTANAGVLLGENTQHAEDTLGMGQIQLGAYKYSSKIVRVSNELLQDSAFDVGSWVARKLGERVARAANAHLTTGDGSSKPNGIFNAATVGYTTVANTGVTADELFEFVHSVDPAYRPNASFMFNDGTFKNIRKLKDGNGQYVLQNAMTVGEAPTILGYKFKINQDAPAYVANAKVAVFGDLRGYTTRLVKGITIIRLTERYADYDQVGFAALARIDGDLIETSAVKALKIKA